MIADELKKSLAGMPVPPQLIFVSREFWAVFVAQIEFRDRDRRRVKREANKAMRRVRRAGVADDIVSPFLEGQ